MSTMSESTSDDSNVATTSSPAFAHTSESLEYAVTHVFLPVWPPKQKDHTHEVEKDNLLARAVCTAAHAYSTHVNGAPEQAHWHRITKMLDNFQASAQSEHLDKDHIISQLCGMQTGGMHTNSL